MQTNIKTIPPDEFVLSVLSPEQRLSAAFKLAEIAFSKTPLTFADIQSAVKKLRKRNYVQKQGSR
jgi:hypothetical protein